MMWLNQYERWRNVLLSMYPKEPSVLRNVSMVFFISSDKAAFMSADGAALCSVH